MTATAPGTGTDKPAGIISRGGWLLAAWLVCFLIALGSAAVFMGGIARDERWGEPYLDIDLSRSSDWRSVPFRVYTAGRYTLHLSTVNHEPANVGARLDADIRVALIDPDGREVFRRDYQGRKLGHQLPDNMSWSTLHAFDLNQPGPKRWTLSVQVLRGDPRFASGRSTILLRKERHDPGMGGLINYVMIIPAFLFTLIALGIAVGLSAKRKVHAPLVLSGLLLIGLGLFSAL